MSLKYIITAKEPTWSHQNRDLQRRNTVKPVQNSNSQNDQKLVFKTNNCLMQLKRIAECSKQRPATKKYSKTSAILLTFMKLSFVIKIFFLSIFEWLFYTGVTASHS